MAQKNGNAVEGFERLQRRYGLRVKRGVIIACACVVIVLAAATVCLTGRARGVEITRGSEAGTAQAVAQAEAQVEPSEPSSDDGAQAQERTDAASEAAVIVDVDGAVTAPGVYEVDAADPRVMDAVEAAGGLVDDADTSRINLASPLQDGEKIYVPREGEDAAPSAAEPSAAEAAGAGDAQGQAGDGLVNFNTANLAELQTLPGVGEATAQAIIEDRKTNGPFESAEDLMRVSGIGEKKFAKLEGMICV